MCSDDNSEVVHALIYLVIDKQSTNASCGHKKHILFKYLLYAYDGISVMNF